MKKKLCLYLLTVSLFMCLSGQSWSQQVALLNTPQVNLLQNGSFERWTHAGIPDAWTNFTVYGTRALVNVSTPCGDNVLRIIDGSTTNGTGLISAAVAATPGLSYTVGAYIKRSDVILNSASLYVKFYNSSGNVITGADITVASTAASNTWDYVSATGTAPANAVTAKVLCYSSVASTGTVYFDGVSLRVASSMQSQCTRYVSFAGTGSGVSAATPAKYNNTSFWNGVKAGLATNSIKVIFLAGDYLINTSEDCLILTNMGSAVNALTLEGEYPYGTVFTRNNASSNQLNMITLQYATNVVIRHLHWEDDTTDTSKLTGYSLVITSATKGSQTGDVVVEGCSFVGLDLNYYGAMGIHQAMTHNVKVSDCEFIRGGYDSHFHMIYNAYGPSNLLFKNNYFQDCAGAYLRLRADTHEANVTANKFVSTGSAYNQPLVQLAVFNNVDPGDETWGYNISITGNSFTYATAYAHAAISLYHKGFDPVKASGGTWNYLLTTAKKTVLTSGSTADKISVLKNDFGLVSGTNLALTINGNERIGEHAYKVSMESWSGYSYTDTNGVLHTCPDYGGDGKYNISDVFPD